MTRNVPLIGVLSVFMPGDYPERLWSEEFAWLWTHHGEKMDAIATRAQEMGLEDFSPPITLGSDGRVWDGHHRLAVAVKLGFDTVPVVFSGELPYIPVSVDWEGEA